MDKYNTRNSKIKLQIEKQSNYASFIQLDCFFKKDFTQTN